MRALALLFLVGCAGDGQIRDQFNVEIDGAVLPVSVRGNADSGKLVVFESGGPSGPGIAERAVDYVVFDESLSDEVAIVMYDRRGTGNALGDYRDDTLTMDRLVEDLRAISRVLDERYNPQTKILAGHSFGALSSQRYLMAHPDDFDGWAPIAPAWTVQDQQMQLDYRFDFLCRVADEQEGDAALWEDMRSWCAENADDPPTVDSKDLDTMYDFLNEIDDRLGAWPTMEPGGLVGALFGSHYNFIDTQMRPNRISDPVWADLKGMDALGELAEIDIPTRIITGRYDDVAPTELAVDGLEALSSEDAALVEIDDAGHYPFHIAPFRIAKTILELF